MIVCTLEACKSTFPRCVRESNTVGTTEGENQIIKRLFGASTSQRIYDTQRRISYLVYFVLLQPRHITSQGHVA